MKYFIPKLEASENNNSQEIFKEKLGGIPFSLPDEKYPLCKQCGLPMSLIAQFEHNSERLDLGRKDRKLFVFLCNGEEICESWDADSGANACFILEPKDFTNQFTKLPNEEFYVEREKIITEWNSADDGIPENLYERFFDDKKYMDLDEDIWDKNPSETKLCGVPSWIQSANEHPGEGWRFIGQLDSAQTDNDFGDLGTGYIFIEILEDLSKLPKCKFFWQCN